jgi:hypothetical protein
MVVVELVLFVSDAIARSTGPSDFITTAATIAMRVGVRFAMGEIYSRDFKDEKDARYC